jgi:hypothetical protein
VGKRRVATIFDITDVGELSDDLIENTLNELCDSRLWPWERQGLVLRTFRHTKSRIINYVRIEAEELNDEFVNNEHCYTIHLLNYGNKEVKFAFRLYTIGQEGYTQYGISIVRIGEYFGCRE